jgi:hypothetical protein
MMVAKQQRKLKFFLNFINVDLDKISIRKIERLGTKLAEHLGLVEFDGLFEKISTRVFDKLVGRKGERLKDLQKRFSSFLEQTMAHTEYIRSHPGVWLEKDEPDPVWKIAEINPQLNVRLMITVEEEITRIDFDGVNAYQSVRLKKDSLRDSRFRVFKVASHDFDGVIYHFIETLNGIPISTVRKCPECGGWFIHLTNRKRDYCSNRCASRKGRRERTSRMKADHPERYEEELKKSRERAHRSYENKVKSKHPKVKVERRPRKTSQTRES